MKIIDTCGREDIAIVFLGMTSRGNEVEFVESIQPPFNREEKEVIIISTLAGCPVKCAMCDAGGFYRGKLTQEEMFEQIDYVVMNRYGANKVNSRKFKIQFARMGEPSFNDAVIDVLRELPERYMAPGLLPSISTIAPCGTDAFFDELIKVKNEKYYGRFQLQFSIHSTDIEQRNKIIPIKKWDFKEIAHYGNRFFGEEDRKITLNFALAADNIVDPAVITGNFDPEKFLIKITPLNPTYKARVNNLVSGVDVASNSLPSHPNLIETLKKNGYDIILSIGELQENRIGSNCGQYVKKHISENRKIQDGYEAVNKSTG